MNFHIFARPASGMLLEHARGMVRSGGGRARILHFENDPDCLHIVVPVRRLTPAGQVATAAAPEAA